MLTDALKQVCACIADGHPNGDHGEWGDNAYAALEIAEKALKQKVNQGWIPVEQALPHVPDCHMRTDDLYLVSVGGVVRVAHHYAGVIGSDPDRWNCSKEFHHKRSWMDATLRGSYKDLLIENVEAWRRMPAGYIKA